MTVRNLSTQYRFVPMSGVNVTSRNEDMESLLEGYASVFDVVDTYGTVLKPGAFSKSLRDWNERDRLPDMYLQHDWSSVIGRWTEMAEDGKGLRVKGSFVRSVFGDHAQALVDSGIATDLSIGFSVMSDKWNEQEKVWEIYDARLFEVSLVTQGATPGAGIQGRSLIRADMNERQIARVLEALGCHPDAADRMAAEYRNNQPEESLELQQALQILRATLE